MRRETRSSKQIAANNLDMAMHRIADSIEMFGSAWLHGNESLETHEMAAKIRLMRGDIRYHMHPQDRKETE